MLATLARRAGYLGVSSIHSASEPTDERKQLLACQKLSGLVDDDGYTSDCDCLDLIKIGLTLFLCSVENVRVRFAQIVHAQSCTRLSAVLIVHAANERCASSDIATRANTNRLPVERVGRSK